MTPTGLIVLVMLGLAAAALATRALRAEAHRRATPQELRGEWWERFEADFRRYAESARAPRNPRDGGRRPGEHRLREPRGDG